MRKSNPRRRTDRLNDLLSKVYINWSESLSPKGRWELHHVTIGKTTALILDMGENGYQVFPSDGCPQTGSAGETVNEEIARLSKGTFVPDSADASDELLNSSQS